MRKVELLLTNGRVNYVSRKGRIEVDLQHATSEMTNIFYVPAIQLNLMPCSRSHRKSMTIGNLKRQLTERHNRNKVHSMFWKDRRERLLKASTSLSEKRVNIAGVCSSEATRDNLNSHNNGNNMARQLWPQWVLHIVNERIRKFWIKSSMACF